MKPRLKKMSFRYMQEAVAFWALAALLCGSVAAGEVVLVEEDFEQFPVGSGTLAGAGGWEEMNAGGGSHGISGSPFGPGHAAFLGEDFRLTQASHPFFGAC